VDFLGKSKKIKEQKKDTMATQISAGELKGTKHLVRTSTGKLYAVFENGAKVEVWYSADGSGWAQKDAGNSPDCMADSPVGVAIDSNDILHIVYYHDAYPASGGLDYITFDTCDGGAQDDAFNIEEEAMGQTDADNLVYGCAIAIDANNIPHAVFVDSDAAKGTNYDTIYYANKIGDSWSAPLEVEGVSNSKNCSLPDLTLDADNKPQITYINTSDNDCGAAHGDANDASAFTLQDVDENVNLKMPSICIDSAGNTYIAYSDADDNQLHLAKLAYGGDWNNDWAELDSGLDCAEVVSIIADLTDIYVFYEDTGDDIHYAKYDGGWTDGGDLEIGTYSEVKARWGFYADNHSGGALVSQETYHFNDSFPSDPQDVWTDDEKAFDGDDTTFAFATDPGTLGWLHGHYTNASSLKTTAIIAVFARTKGKDSEGYADIIFYSGGVEIGTIYNLPEVAGYTNWIKLDVPAGGWNWSKVRSLSARFETPANSGDCEWYITEVKVFVRVPASEIDYLFKSGVNALWNKLVLIPPFDSILKRWSGAAWLKAKLKRWSGSAWKDQDTEQLKYYDGATFKSVDAGG